MRLLYSPFHRFIHKVLITAHEAGFWDDITFIATSPFNNSAGEDQGDAYSIAALNPLDKVPTPVLDTGQVVYGSQAVVECLDSMNKTGTPLYPPAGPARWEAVTRRALSDTIFESTVQLVMEGWQPEDPQRIVLFEWVWPKFIRGLDELARYCAGGFAQFDIGQAVVLHAISYMACRAKFYDAKDPLYPDFDWFRGRPALKAWRDEAIERPSVKSHYNVDVSGADSAAYCHEHVAAILVLQHENVFR